MQRLATVRTLTASTMPAFRVHSRSVSNVMNKGNLNTTHLITKSISTTLCRMRLPCTHTLKTHMSHAGSMQMSYTRALCSSIVRRQDTGKQPEITQSKDAQLQGDADILDPSITSTHGTEINTSSQLEESEHDPLYMEVEIDSEDEEIDGEGRGRMVDANEVRATDTATRLELEDIVEMLNFSHCRDVVTIDIRRRSDSVDYMIIATCLAMRHIKSVSQSLTSKFKGRRHKGSRVSLEGEPESKWMVVNMGDIQIHLMEENLRRRYELEKLWTLGRDDEQLRTMGDNTAIMKDPGH